MKQRPINTLASAFAEFEQQVLRGWSVEARRNARTSFYSGAMVLLCCHIENDEDFLWSAGAEIVEFLGGPDKGEALLVALERARKERENNVGSTDTLSDHDGPR